MAISFSLSDRGTECTGGMYFWCVCMCMCVCVCVCACVHECACDHIYGQFRIGVCEQWWYGGIQGCTDLHLGNVIIALHSITSKAVHEIQYKGDAS